MPVTLQVVFECHSLPAPGLPQATCRRLGIQDGKEVIQDVPFEGQAEIRFAFPLQVALDPAAGSVIFKGKYVQGPRGDPFIYLCWGERVEGEWTGCGRSKIPLNPIPRALIEQALEPGGGIRARIGLSDRRGSPAFATLNGDQVVWGG